MRGRAAGALLGVLALAAAVAGCGGASAGPKRAHDFPPEAGLLVAALGDSITAGSPRWDPDPGVRNRIGAPALDPESQYPYWAEVRLGGRARVRNCGVSGQRTDEIARRLDACATGAEVLIVQAGVNDLAQGRSVASAAANLRAMVRRGRARGLPVLLAELLPWNDGPPGSAAQIRALNRRIATIARDEDATLLPFHRALADPADPDRMPRALTADGEHPSVAGYRRLGAVVARALGGKAAGD